MHVVCLCHCCSVAQMCPTPWTAARQASLSITSSRSLLTLTSMESVMPSSHLILCRPLLLLPSRVFVYVSDMRVCLGGGPGCMKSWLPGPSGALAPHLTSFSDVRRGPVTQHFWDLVSPACVWSHVACLSPVP